MKEKGDTTASFSSSTSSASYSYNATAATATSSSWSSYEIDEVSIVERDARAVGERGSGAGAHVRVDRSVTGLAGVSAERNPPERARRYVGAAPRSNASSSLLDAPFGYY